MKRAPKPHQEHRAAPLWRHPVIVAAIITGFAAVIAKVVPPFRPHDDWKAQEERVPPPPVDKPLVVVFGPFRMQDGSSDGGLRDSLISSFPHSSRLRIVADASSQSHPDIQIEGKVIRVRKTLVDNHQDKERMRPYVSALALSQIPEQVKRIEAAVATEATFSADQTVIMKTAEAVRDLEPDLDDRAVIPEMIKEAARESPAKLFATLTDTSVRAGMDAGGGGNTRGD